MTLAHIAETFTAAISREAWRVLGASNSPLRNNGSRMRMQPRDVEAAAHQLLTNPEALARFIEEVRVKR